MSVKSQHKITHQQADGAVYVPFEKIYIVDSDDAVSNISYIPVEAGAQVMGVLVRVTETLVGGTPALLVGDSDADDTWIVSGDTCETAGDLVNEPTPKYYAANDYVKITWQASHSAGIIEIRILMSGKEAADPPWTGIAEIS